MSLPTITSVDNARVKAVVKLRRGRRRRGAGLFVAEGTREVGRAIAAGLTAREWFVCPELLESHATAGEDDAKRNDRPKPDGESASRRGTTTVDDWRRRIAAPGFAVPPRVFAKMTYRDDPEGVLAVFETPVWSLASLAGRMQNPASENAAADHPTVAAPSGNAAASHSPLTPPSREGDQKNTIAEPLFLVAVGLSKPGNFGAMARTAAAAGATAILAADTQVDPFNPNAIRASTGAVFTLPIVCDSAANIVAWLREHHVKLFAAITDSSAQPHTDADLTGRCAIAIGAEDRGLPPHWIDDARATGGAAITIATDTRIVDSLNASVAAGVLLFEAIRQRHCAQTTRPQSAKQR